MAKVHKDMIIADVLKLHDGAAEVLFRAGLPCVGCPGAQRETLEEAGLGHGLDMDGVIEELNLLLETEEA